ncbi:MAG TPA: hypothetical protein PKA64_07380 [Myxococcota bacterium]|nr:hypothetical protein [Myxococcota bacterium]
MRARRFPWGALVGSLAVSGVAAAAPVRLPIQGELRDSAGNVVDGQLRVDFRLMGEPYLAATLYEEELLVTFSQGAFTVSLGGPGLLDSELFRLDQQVWLGIQIQGDDPMDPIAVGWSPLAAYAAHAGDAESLDGLGSADFLPAGWQPRWTDIQDRPPGLDDGDNVSAAPGGGVVYGDDFQLDGDVLSLDADALDARVRAVCYDAPDELRGALDGAYRPGDWTPAWSDLRDVPPGFADGLDDGTVYTAGAGLRLAGQTFSLDVDAVEDAARAVCFDDPAELSAALDGVYLPVGWRPDWAEIDNVPPEVLTSDAIVYEAGIALNLNHTRFDVDQATIQGWIREVAYDSEADLRAQLDNDYQSILWRPSFYDIDAMPAGFADGRDDDTRYDAGEGLTLADGAFSVDAAWVDAAARAVCYDTPAELTALLDPRYRSVSWVPAWVDVDGVPAGFADGVDDDGFADVWCPEGQSLIGSGGGWDCADLRDNPLDAEDLAAMLTGADVDLGAGTTVGGVPLTSSVYTDENAIDAVQAAWPELRTWERSPLIQMGLNTELCDHSASSAYGGILQFPTIFTAVPTFVSTLDQTSGSAGASWASVRRLGTDRVMMTCNAPSDGLAWMAVDRGRHVVDGRPVEAGFDAVAVNSEFINFSAPFPSAPIVLLETEDTAWARVVGAVGTTGFQVYLSETDKPLHWIAMAPGEYRYGRYHWVAGRAVDPDVNDRFAIGATFHSLPAVLMSVEDTNNSGGAYTRLIDVTTSDFQLYIDGVGAEYLHFVAFEEDR